MEVIGIAQGRLPINSNRHEKMDGQQAFRRLKLEAKHAGEPGRASQKDIAEAIGVSPPTLHRWLSRTAPPGGANLKLLVAWAEKLQPLPIAVDVLVTAQQETAENIVRLTEISGYAKFVLDAIEQVANQQRKVVESLKPWVLREEKAVLSDEQAKARVKQLEGELAQMRATEAQSSHPDTDAASSHTPAVPGNAASEEGSPRRRGS